MIKIKSKIECVKEMEKAHKLKKLELSGRVQVSRVLVQRYYDIKRAEYCNEDDYIKNCEAVLDNLLVRYEYNIDLIIEKWQKIVPALKRYPDICDTCGYRPPFCGYSWDSECTNRMK